VVSVDGSDDSERVVFQQDHVEPAEAGRVRDLGELRSKKGGESP
jgi:hypothetical protein